MGAKAIQWLLKGIWGILSVLALNITANLATPWIQQNAGVIADFFGSVWAQIIVFAILLVIGVVTHFALNRITQTSQQQPVLSREVHSSHSPAKDAESSKPQSPRILGLTVPNEEQHKCSFCGYSFLLNNAKG